ncbi:hypothetical protein MAR_006331 [Mya arenaria]|uniref:Uncharacterized protein n=1 Tax=Mya arenaria TaxID=6604 RepID=A0ABY7DFS0_MYAAR|nr:hypothetical protein MAR_006331 [Mya arenaria]
MINETAIPLGCQSSCPNLLVTMVNKFNDSDPCGFIVSKECILNYLVECSNDTVRLNIANQRGGQSDIQNPGDNQSESSIQRRRNGLIEINRLLEKETYKYPGTNFA